MLEHGSGLLEAARGSSHVNDGVSDLRGEVDIFGRTWDPVAWARASAARTAWSGGRLAGLDLERQRLERTDLAWSHLELGHLVGADVARQRLERTDLARRRLDHRGGMVGPELGRLDVVGSELARGGPGLGRLGLPDLVLTDRDHGAAAGHSRRSPSPRGPDVKREPLSGAVQQTRAQTMVVAARAFAGGETLRVTLLVVGMVVVSAVMGHRVLEAPAYAGAVVVPWWLLAACFAVTEAVVMHIQVKREAQAVSVSELPLVLGLFFVAPLELVLARLVGSLLVFVLLRRSSVLKTVFNAALVTLESCTALLVFHLVAGDLLGVGPREWVAAYAAALTANALGAVALGLVIAVYEGELSVRDLAREALGGQPVAPLVVTLALVAVNSLTLDPGSVYLLLGAGVVLVLGYRGYAALADRHLNLERLYHFSQAVTNSPASDELLHSVLRQACEILAATMLSWSSPARRPRRPRCGSPSARSVSIAKRFVATSTVRGWNRRSSDRDSPRCCHATASSPRSSSGWR